jgi:outer membrane biosynthesis protein TonB
MKFVLLALFLPFAAFAADLTEGIMGGPVELKHLSPDEADAVVAAAGGSLSKVKSAGDAKKKATPFYPYELRRAGESASAICLFEVTAKGRVGRIYRVGSGSDAFFKECVIVLQDWRFAKQSAPTYRIIQFEAQNQNPP